MLRVTLTLYGGQCPNEPAFFMTTASLVAPFYKSHSLPRKQKTRSRASLSVSQVNNSSGKPGIVALSDKVSVSESWRARGSLSNALIPPRSIFGERVQCEASINKYWPCAHVLIKHLKSYQPKVMAIQSEYDIIFAGGNISYH